MPIAWRRATATAEGPAQRSPEDVRHLGDAFAALHRRLDELHAELLDPASGRGTVAIG